MLSCKKVQGMNHLSKFGWPTLPTLIVNTECDLDKLERFCAENSEVANWFLRNIKPVPDRYEIGSIVMKNRDLALMLTGQKEAQLESLMPFALQPYIKASSSGVVLVREKTVLVEFTMGVGDILRGTALPMRCLMHFKDRKLNIDEFELSKNSQLPSWLLKHVKRAVEVIPIDELRGEQPKLAEWVATSEGEVYYVDYHIMPSYFLQDYTPLVARPKTICPGNFNFPLRYLHRDALSTDEDFVLVANLPYIDIAKICAKKSVRGLLIEEGGWLSHVARFAAETRLPCLFGLV